jgi:hypothetical protein
MPTTAAHLRTLTEHDLRLARHGRAGLLLDTMAPHS